MTTTDGLDNQAKCASSRSVQSRVGLLSWASRARRRGYVINFREPDVVRLAPIEL